MDRSWTPRLRDAALPGALAVLGAVELVALAPRGLGAALALEWAACALLMWRRRWPLPVCTLAGALALLLPHVGVDLDDPANPILIVGLAGFSLARYLPDLRGLTGIGLFLALLAPAYLRSEGRLPGVSDVVFVSAFLVPPYVVGLITRTLADRNARLAEQAEQLTRYQDTVRREAAAAERGRIARELHDVLAHSVSAMVVQAAAAADLVRADPDRALVALHKISDAGRRGLAETGRLLHLIRDTDDEFGLEPDRGLDRLPDLVEEFRRSGLVVDVSIDGTLAGLPAGIDLSGYRIVQEALTNALKYASDRTASVRVARTPNELRICAENRGRPGPSTGSGLGLVGMAERVSVFGGTLTHGFAGDRFLLATTLPLNQEDA